MARWLQIGFNAAILALFLGAAVEMHTHGQPISVQEVVARFLPPFLLLFCYALINVVDVFRSHIAVADVQTLYFPIVLTAGVVFVILASKQSNAATHDALDRVGYMLIGVASGLVVGGGVRRRSQRPVTPDGEGSK